MRLIDADELMKKVLYLPTGQKSHGVPIMFHGVVAADVDDMPTIDPESLLPRGTWEGTANGYADGELVYDTWTCSECGYTVDTDDPDDLTKFCPNCGAKMEGGHNP